MGSGKADFDTKKRLFSSVLAGQGPEPIPQQRRPKLRIENRMDMPSLTLRIDDTKLLSEHYVLLSI